MLHEKQNEKVLVDIDALYGCNPVTYPDSTIIDGKVLCDLFPFHVVFDRQLVIKQCGSKLQKMSGEQSLVFWLTSHTQGGTPDTQGR